MLYLISKFNDLILRWLSQSFFHSRACFSHLIAHLILFLSESVKDTCKNCMRTSNLRTSEAEQKLTVNTNLQTTLLDAYKWKSGLQLKKKKKLKFTTTSPLLSYWHHSWCLLYLWSMSNNNLRIHKQENKKEYGKWNKSSLQGSGVVYSKHYILFNGFYIFQRWDTDALLK